VRGTFVGLGSASTFAVLARTRFEPSAMVERVWVGGWGRGGLLWTEFWGKSLSGWRHWLVHLGGIIMVVFVLGTWWAPNVEDQTTEVA
jgi:hypothetical protein